MRKIKETLNGLLQQPPLIQLTLHEAKFIGIFFQMCRTSTINYKKKHLLLFNLDQKELFSFLLENKIIDKERFVPREIYSTHILTYFLNILHS